MAGKDWISSTAASATASKAASELPESRFWSKKGIGLHFLDAEVMISGTADDHRVPPEMKNPCFI